MHILRTGYASTSNHRVGAVPVKQSWRLGSSWWRHQMKTFSASLAICAGNSPVPGEFPTQRPVTRSYDVFFELRLNKRLSKQWWVCWFETPSCPLWRHCNMFIHQRIIHIAKSTLTDCVDDTILHDLNCQPKDLPFWTTSVFHKSIRHEVKLLPYLLPNLIKAGNALYKIIVYLCVYSFNIYSIIARNVSSNTLFWYGLFGKHVLRQGKHTQLWQNALTRSNENNVSWGGLWHLYSYPVSFTKHSLCLFW